MQHLHWVPHFVFVMIISRTQDYPHDDTCSWRKLKIKGQTTEFPKVTHAIEGVQCLIRLVNKTINKPMVFPMEIQRWRDYKCSRRSISCVCILCYLLIFFGTDNPHKYFELCFALLWDKWYCNLHDGDLFSSHQCESL